jgi:hypothetical protein
MHIKFKIAVLFGSTLTNHKNKSSFEDITELNTSTCSDDKFGNSGLSDIYYLKFELICSKPLACPATLNSSCALGRALLGHSNWWLLSWTRCSHYEIFLHEIQGRKLFLKKKKKSSYQIPNTHAQLCELGCRVGSTVEKCVICKTLDPNGGFIRGPKMLEFRTLFFFYSLVE